MIRACVLAAALLGPGLALASEVCNGPYQTVLQAGVGALDARAIWTGADAILWPGAAPGDRYALYHAAAPSLRLENGRVAGAELRLALRAHNGRIPAAYRYAGSGALLRVPAAAEDIRTLLRGQLLLAREDAQGRVLDSTALQHAGALDALYAAAGNAGDLGATPSARGTRFKLWAPTARSVALCVYAGARTTEATTHAMQRDARTGIWSARLPGDLSGRYYRYAVDVHVRAAGLVRNRVSDPYAISGNADGVRSYIGRLDDARLKPSGWDATVRPRVAAQTDMAIYELHVRDFSAGDQTVPPAHRGKYLAFTHPQSNGMRHLAALAQAGMTDVHLLPIFDFGTVPERGCVTPAIEPPAAPDSEAPQQAVTALAARDCYNWGYDPVHFNAPEGSYALDADDGASRILELRRMVQALHRAGLRVGMDVVYNHTVASGQHEKAVLDRIVPGYYQRLDKAGTVERSTCCDNTATEHRMMEKLMSDSAALWVRHYAIDSFRFDLMGHQPRAAMERLQRRLDELAGHKVQLIGEGWNFGEVENGARFVQASQLSLNGSGIGTFSDRARDAIRGGGPADSGEAQLAQQGYINGLVLAPNAHAPARPAQDLLRAADMARVGLAGSVRGYAMQTWDGQRKTLAQIDYNGQPAGYASAPGETVNYVENHDNQTLYDLNALKLPAATDARARTHAQMLGAAMTAFSQGVAYFHAGLDMLRSKSLDRNSYESGDWFNRIDYTYQDNGFGGGLPPRGDNGAHYALYGPVLRNPAIKPAPSDIALARGMFRDLLRIRASSALFRLRSADEIAQRLRFHNTGPSQNAAVIVGELDGAGYPDARFKRVLYFINVAPAAQTLALPGLRTGGLQLHPVHLAPGAADSRIAQDARIEAATSSFTLPARSALVFVEPAS